jgi:TatA/E family protein of Tat protein translocase
MFGLGMGEIVVIVVIAIVLFGTNDLPKTLRKVAKGVNEFKKVANDAQRSWTEVRDDVARTIMAADLENTVRDAVSDKPLKQPPQGDHPYPADDPTIQPAAVPGGSEGEPAVGGDATIPPQNPAFTPQIEPEESGLPVAQPVAQAIPRTAEGHAVDQHHDHHEERGTEPAEAPADPAGLRKPS